MTQQNKNTELHKAVVVQRQAPAARTLLKVQRLSSCGPSTRSSTSLSRCRGRNPESQKRFQQTKKIPQSKDSENHGDSPRSEDSEDHGDPLSWRIQKNVEIFQLQYTVKVVRDTAEISEDSEDAAGSLRSWSRSLTEWWTLKLCSRLPGTERLGKSKRLSRRQVQFKEMNQQYRNGCRTQEDPDDC